MPEGLSQSKANPVNGKIDNDYFLAMDDRFPENDFGRQQGGDRTSRTSPTDTAPKSLFLESGYGNLPNLRGSVLKTNETNRFFEPASKKAIATQRQPPI
jgi:hypothetical protein